MDAETFALWTWERDRAVGATDEPFAREVKTEYIEEAKFYLGGEKQEWPCGILLREGTHAQFHKDCKTTNPLD